MRQAALGSRVARPTSAYSRSSESPSTSLRTTCHCAPRPDLVTEIAGIASTGYLDGDAGELGGGNSEILELRCAKRLKNRARGRSLDGERSDVLGNIGKTHIHAGGVVLEPAQIGLGRGHAKHVLSQTSHRAIVDDLAGVVAPRRVEHLAYGRSEYLARDDEIEKTRRVGAVHEVFVQRRDIEEPRRGADHVVFALVAELVGARDEMAGPAPPRMAHAERGGALVKRSGLQHLSMRVPVAA